MGINVQQMYQQNQVKTASPQELVLMLYNGGIKFCSLAKKAIQEKNFPEAHSYLIRAQDALTELQVGLNRDLDISRNLDLLYDFMKYRLVQANFKKDPVIIDEVIEFFIEFRDTWKQAMELAKKQSIIQR
jgi:flagellar protein FliS